MLSYNNYLHCDKTQIGVELVNTPHFNNHSENIAMQISLNIRYTK